MLERWHPAAAVGLTTLIFAVAHVDPRHVVAVIPLGAWLGVVAWLSGSTWPAIICHTANNAFAVLITRAYPDAPVEHIRFDAAGLTMLGTSGVFLVLALWVMWKYRAPREAPEN